MMKTMMLKGSSQSLKNQITAVLKPLLPLPVDIQPQLSPVPPVKALLLDIYGTLLVSGTGDIGVAESQAKELSLKEIYRSAGFKKISPELSTRTPPALEELIRRRHQELKEAGADYPEVDIQEIWSQVLKQFLAQDLIKGKNSPAAAQKMALGYELQVNPVWAMPGFPGILQKLKKKGFRLGIVSNAQFYTPLTLEALTKKSLTDLGFEEELCAWSWKLERAKPSPQVFAGPLARLAQRGITPQEVLYLGNDMLNDVTAAAQAGCKTALFAGDKRSYRPRKEDQRCQNTKPDLILTSLGQLDSVLTKEGLSKKKKKAKNRKRPRKGRGFFLTFLFLLLLGGAGFYLGWVPFQLEEGQYGVMFSKTSGYKTQPLEAGVFSWYWEALIPGSVTLHVFPLETREVEIQRSGKWGAGELYGSILPQEYDFSWDLHMEIVYRLLPEALPELLSRDILDKTPVTTGWVKKNVLDEETAQWYESYEARLMNQADSIIAQAITAKAPKESLNPASLGIRIQENLQAGETNTEIIAVKINKISLPDGDLYTKAQNLYFQLLETIKIERETAESLAITKEEAAKAGFKLLEEYGRILTESPILIDFLSMGDNLNRFLPSLQE